MKAASLKEIKTELNHRSTQELLELCLRLSKFKKENKELLTYLLFESADEEAFIHSIKNKVDSDFKTINTKSFPSTMVNLAFPSVCLTSATLEISLRAAVHSLEIGAAIFISTPFFFTFSNQI